MTVRVEPPTRYRHWTGRPANTHNTAGWPHPELRRTPDGRLWLEQTTTDRWAPLGYRPRPTSRWQRACHHVHHGRLMGYPWPSVLAFALRGLAGRLPGQGATP